MDEQLELSKDFKKAYNHADMIINQMPHILEGMQPSKTESSEYTRGFNARLKLYDIERDAVKGMSRQNLLKNHSKSLSALEKESDSIRNDKNTPTKE